MSKNILTTVLMAAAIAAGACTIPSVCAGESDWRTNVITPVLNPLFFEDARITSEVRPVFIQHWLPDTYHFSGGSVPLGGDVRVYAAQIRVALTERLALIATKDGYIEFKPDHTLSHSYGWADLAAGLKYLAIADDENQFLLTPGFTLTVPTGSERVFQGDGAGEWNVFASAVKGFDDFHLTGNLGFRIPNNFSRQTAQGHYSLQADYKVHDYFIPFVALNGYTMLSNGKDKLLGAVPLDTEFSDLANFGSTDVAGHTQLTLGGGFRSRLHEQLDVGVGYELGVTSPKGIFENRLTADVIWRF
jgi:hypothetical protein